MNRHRAFSLLTVALACSAVASIAADRNIQKWVDEKGVVHYGDAPPPDAARQGRSVLNEQGVVVRQIPRQLSPDEAAAARVQQEQESRRKAQDSFLLATYTRAADIERVRDDQLALIDSQIDLARLSVSNNETRIEGLTRRLQGFKPYSKAANARRVPDQLAAEVVQALGERRSSQETLAKHEQRRHETSSKFEADIVRYRELTTRPSIR